ncbi:MAG TPA: FAD:protein FMN transferase [Tahibacter sp.]|uniref:FAD:protein FMN transferase n=1 Tax=Tahibacter sp. TaxID=2056211 RepID=UPI002D1CBF75|nr:FAD:protein FMN transferase [Tahibacter sp.]HSX62501.1 FAD:protein FMN transferase [Tahibacter sp.]
MRRLFLFAALAAALLLGAARLYRQQQALAPHKASFVIFGGLTEVELRGVPAETASRVFGAIGEVLQRDQRAWHPWEISDLMRLNAAIAQGEPYRASPELSGLLRRAQRAYADSDGLFNAAIGSLVDLWGFHTSEFPIVTPPPPQQNIDATLATQPRMDQLTIAEDGTVVSTNRAMQLDLNGLAEGYAAEQIAEIVRRHAAAGALINVGGDVLAIGRAGERPWRVGISSPQHRDFAGAELGDGEALFTSGNYNKYREDAGQRWGHVLDPRTGKPARGVVAVSVIHDDAVVADVGATALMIAGPGDLVRIARRLGIRCVLLVADDGTTWLTPAMRKRLEFAEPPARVEVTEDLGAECGAGSE